MCGIIGCVCDEEVAPLLLRGLRRVEYRGYDSAGMATISDGRLWVRKGVGRVQEIEERYQLSAMKGRIGMAHTRWATHGGVTEANAHPQTSCDDLVAVVHNGIIENHVQLRKKLVSEGHVFKSETDTEVVPHLIEKAYTRTRDPVKSVVSAAKRLKGQYALVVMFRDRPDTIVGVRKDAPLIVGVGDGRMFVASDVLAFIEQTDKTLFLENAEAVEITRGGAKVFGPDGRRVRRRPTQVAWELSDLSKMDYAHYTLKEINEQPATVQSAADQDEGALAKFTAAIKGARSVFITGAGTSYHAALLMRLRLIKEAGIRCDAILAGEFGEHSEFVDGGSVLVVFSQSGETADVLEAVSIAKRRGAKVLAVVNPVGSSLARESDAFLLLNCGPEVGVAATKSFTAQVAISNLIVDRLIGAKAGRIKDVSKAVEKALQSEEKILKITEAYKDRPDFYFVAKGSNQPLALEGALKLKELSYVHAEGMAASELKHGTLALMEPGTPVVVINPSGTTHDDVLSSAEELRARGAHVIGISDVEDPVYTHWIRVPKVRPESFPLVCAVPLQLLAYHFAVALRNDPDYPRNLAKSVTVK